MSELNTPATENEAQKQQFLANLAAFLVEAGQNGWAADVPPLAHPQRPGFKELLYRRDEWEYRDSYAGYYMAPGSSVVYYKGRPAWYMTYGGDGQTPKYFNRAKETFAFLRRALMNPDPALPIRGPQELHDSEIGLFYSFMIRSDYCTKYEQ